jgi:hypothetical protein
MERLGFSKPVATVITSVIQKTTFPTQNNFTETLIMNRPKIKVFQYMYGDHKYFSWSERINRRYCERHGYDYVICRDKPRKDRHICWHKIPAMLAELHDCDYLLCIDADAVFYSHELTIDNELIPELRDHLILMPADCGCEANRWHSDLSCDGVMFMKNDVRVREFVTEWDRVSDYDKKTCWTWPPTQIALWRHVLPKFKGVVRIVTDYYLVHGRLGQFIRHFYLSSDEKRTHAMKAIYQRLFGEES